MRVVLSVRAERELGRHFKRGVRKFGAKVAENTYRKIDRVLRVTLSDQPYIGRYMVQRKVYRYVIAGTPFVVYYHIDADVDELSVVAIRHGAQDRTEFEGG
jgi:plasmid stabilization system protein ParE